MIIECTNCRKKVNKKPFAIKKYKNCFCSLKCKYQKMKRGNLKPCSFCKKDVYRTITQIKKKSKSGRRFCNRKCSNSFNNKLYRTGENHPNWTNGYGSYRSRALKYYDKKCVGKECPFGGNVDERMLDVDHKDSDTSNNKLSNLQVICVWCHALKTRNIRD